MARDKSLVRGKSLVKGKSLARVKSLARGFGHFNVYTHCIVFFIIAVLLKK